MIHQPRGGGWQELLECHGEVFQAELGTLKGCEAKIHMDPGAKPRFCKEHSYTLREKVEQELDRPTKEGITEPIQFTHWSATIVPVIKKDRTSLQISENLKVTVNQVLKLDKYDGLFAQLTGGKGFTKLDMSQAHQQLVLEEDSQKTW